MTTPTTPTGKLLLDDMQARWPERGRSKMRLAIADALPTIEAEAAAQERERLLAEGWREPHRHMFTSFGDPNPTTQCAGESCGVLYGDLHPEPA